MKGLALTMNGLEDIAANEIKSILKTNTKKLTGIVLFDFKKETDLCKLAYNLRSVTKIIYLYKIFNFSTKKDLIKKISEINFSKFIKNSFVVKCNRLGNHNFNSNEIEREVGEVILEKYKTKVDLKNATTIIYLDINDTNCVIGIDFSGNLLNKRFYKVKNYRNSLNACLAFSLLKIAGWKTKETLLNVNCGTGEVLIEAALYACKIPQGFNRKEEFPFLRLLNLNSNFFNQFDNEINKKIKLKIIGIDGLFYNVRNSIINAKIATVDDKIKFENYNIEWLDTKFKENSIDKIIAQFVISKRDKDVEKNYREFFNQSKNILKKKCLIILVINKTDFIKEIAEKYNFRLFKELQAFIGEAKYNILVFKKSI